THLKRWIEDRDADAKRPGLALGGMLDEFTDRLSVQVGVEDKAALAHKPIEMV
ncbi:MAG: hypothetical protein JWP34_4723, partial [Massilia sp.]|nr:hypothetical protein [Massilia sp.]